MTGRSSWAKAKEAKCRAPDNNVSVETGSQSSTSIAFCSGGDVALLNAAAASVLNRRDVTKTAGQCSGKPVGKRRVNTKEAALALWRESAKVETGERLQYALEMVDKLESEVGK